MSDEMKQLNNDIGKISEHLSKKQSDFDSVMDMSRKIIRDSGQAITLMHNNEIKRAASLFSIISKNVNKLKRIDGEFRYYTLQAYQEYTEAAVFRYIKTKHQVPSMRQIGVSTDAYLLGLMDVVGELKREILDSLRENRLKDAELYFDVMKNIYDSTRGLRFAEAVINGFRKKQDVARIQIENAGSEILMFKSRK